MLSSRYTLRSLLAFVTLLAIACPFVFDKPNRGSVVIPLPTQPRDGPLSTLGWQQYVDLQLSMIEASEIANEATDRLAAAMPNSPYQSPSLLYLIHSSIDVTFKPNNLIEIALVSDDASENDLQLIVETIANVYSERMTRELEVGASHDTPMPQ